MDTLHQSDRHIATLCTHVHVCHFTDSFFLFEVMYLFFEPRFASEIALSELCAVEVVALTALPVLIVPGKTTHAYLRLQRVLGRCLGVHVQCLTRSPHGDFFFFCLWLFDRTLHFTGLGCGDGPMKIRSVDLWQSPRDPHTHAKR